MSGKQDSVHAPLLEAISGRPLSSRKNGRLKNFFTDFRVSSPRENESLRSHLDARSSSSRTEDRMKLFIIIATNVALSSLRATAIDIEKPPYSPPPPKPDVCNPSFTPNIKCYPFGVWRWPSSLLQGSWCKSLPQRLQFPTSSPTSPSSS